MRFDEKTVTAAKVFVFQKTFGSARLLMKLPEKERALCIRALKLIQQSEQTKGTENGTTTAE